MPIVVVLAALPIVVVLAVLVVAGLFLLRNTGERDTPARIVTIAANRFPAHRRDWGRAMVAELTQIHGRARRWRFTAGVLRVVLFPPPRHRNRMLVVAVAGLMVAATATVAAAREVPGLSVFVAVLGLLVCGYATVVTARSQRPGRGALHMIVGAVALAGVTAAVAAVVRIALAYPAAITDGAHVFSILFALALTGYLALAFTPPRLGDHTNTVLCWALAASLASGAVWTIIALSTPVTTDGIAPFLSWVSAAATLIASIGVSAATRSRLAGGLAGLLTVVLSAPMHFALNVTAVLQRHHYTLTDPYDIAAYPHSGYPDVASYILSDIVAGNILAGLVLSPIVLLALVPLGAVTGTGLHHLAARRAARTTA